MPPKPIPETALAIALGVIQPPEWYKSNNICEGRAFAVQEPIKVPSLGWLMAQRHENRSPHVGGDGVSQKAPVAHVDF